MPMARMSVLQAALYIAVVSTLVMVFLDRVQAYSALAERAAVDVTLNNVRSALYVRLAQDRMQGTLSREHLWDGGNPFAIVSITAANYAGELEGPEALAALPEGAWAFDRRMRELVYRPGYRRGLEIGEGGTLLRFRLRVRDSGSLPQIEPVVPYRWEP